MRFVLIEAGIAWVPALLWRLDEDYRALRKETPWLKRLPSEYAREHIRLSTQPLEQPRSRDALWPALADIGAQDMLLFASDYPHWDFDDPTVLRLPADWRPAAGASSRSTGAASGYSTSAGRSTHCTTGARTRRARCARARSAARPCPPTTTATRTVARARSSAAPGTDGSSRSPAAGASPTPASGRARTPSAWRTARSWWDCDRAAAGRDRRRGRCGRALRLRAARVRLRGRCPAARRRA